MKPLVLGEAVLFNDDIRWPPPRDPMPGVITSINADGTYGVSFLSYAYHQHDSKWNNTGQAFYGFRDGYLPPGYFARVGEVGPLCKQITREGE